MKTKQLNTYTFKAVWDSTAVRIVVEAEDEIEAQEKAERRILRTEGGIRCREVRLVGRV